MPANIPNQQTQAELNNLGAPVTTRTISFLELVQRSWGEEFRAPDRGIYEMTAGRKFDSTDTGSTGIYAGGNGPFMPTPPNPTPAPPSGPADPYWANVSMLLRGVPPSGSSWIRDYSQYATGITNYGNPQVSGLSYLFNTDSMRFDGASYCAKAGDAHTNFGTGDFCIEGWVNPDTSTGVQTVMARNNNTGPGLALQITAGFPEICLLNSNNIASIISGADPYLQYVSLLLATDYVPEGDLPHDTSGNLHALTGNAYASSTQTLFSRKTLAFNGSSNYITVSGNIDQFDFGTQDFSIEAWAFSTDNTGLHVIYSRQSDGNYDEEAIQLRTSGNVFEGVIRIGLNTVYNVTGVTPYALNVWNNVIFSRTNNVFTLVVNGHLETTLALTTTLNLPSQTLPTIGALFEYTGPTITLRSNWFSGYIAAVRVTKGVSRPNMLPTQPYIGIDTFTNYFIWSEDVSHWYKDGSLTITTYTGTDPFGNSGTIYRISIPATGSPSRVAGLVTGVAQSLTPMYGSMWIKRVSGGNQTGLSVQSSTVAPNSGGAYIASLLTLTSSWSRYSVGGVASGTLAGNFGFFVGNEDRIPAISGLPAIVVDVFGGQFEIDTTATGQYVATTGSVRSQSFVPSGQSIIAPTNQWTYLKASRASGTFSLQVNSTVAATSATAIDLTFNSSAPFTSGATVQSSPSNYFTGYLEELRVTNGNARGSESVPSDIFPTH